jgi:hypothetical protein
MSRDKTELRWVRIDAPVDGELDLVLADQAFPPRDPGDIVDLMSSVRLHGILSPLLVRRIDGRLEVVCGYRRFLAARAAGLTEVPVMIAELDDAQAIRAYLSENLVRRPLDPRAEEGAVGLLRSLRHGARAPGDLGEAMRDAIAAARRVRLETIAGAARTANRDAMPGETDARDPLRASEVAWRLLERMEGFLGDIARTKRIEVRRANSMADILLELVELGPVDWQPLARGGDGDLTAAHSLLSAALCARAATVLGWNEADTRSFVLGGLLHDTGMVFLQRPSIRSPRGLTPAERGELEGHTRIGCALVSGTGAWRNEVAIAARDHHERWNGSGYPEGRKGATVDLQPRLLAPLDTFASLVMPRPHRDALSPDAAFGRIAKAVELGLYDPGLLPILARIVGPERDAARAPRILAAPLPLAGNSVEMGGDLATMLSEEST